MDRQDCVSTFASPKVMTSLHYSDQSGHILTSHPDGKVRIWDTRQQDEAQTLSIFSSGGDVQWVSQVCTHQCSFTVSFVDGRTKESNLLTYNVGSDSSNYSYTSPYGCDFSAYCSFLIRCKVSSKLSSTYFKINILS